MNATNGSSITCPQSAKTVKASATLLIGGIGLFGNVFIIVLATKYTVTKNLHHLIINMAFADALVAIMTSLQIVPPLFDFNIFSVHSDLLRKFMCKILGFVFNVFRLVSLVTLLIISAERYKATRGTVQISRPYSLKQRIAVLTCSWFIPMVVNIYVLVLATFKGNICWYPWSTLPWFGVYHSFTAVTFCIAIILSLLTLRTLAKSPSIEAHLPEAHRQARERRMARVVKMVLWSLLLYSTNLPLIIFKVLEFLLLSGVNFAIFYSCQGKILLFAVRFLPLINSCFSPCVYIIFLRDFQQAAKKVLCLDVILKNRRTGVIQRPYGEREELGVVNSGAVIGEYKTCSLAGHCDTMTTKL